MGCQFIGQPSPARCLLALPKPYITRVRTSSFKLELTNFLLPPTLGLAIIKLINFDHEIHLNTIERFVTNQDHRPFLFRKR